MFSFQYPGPQTKIPFTTKIAIVIWIFVILAILSFFTFSFFIIALLAGIVAFAANLFQKKHEPNSNKQTDFPKQHYRPTHKEKDNDIIELKAASGELMSKLDNAAVKPPIAPV